MIFVRELSHKDHFSRLALTERARCYIANDQYEQARQDLDLLRSIDPENAEAEVRTIDHWRESFQ